MIGHRALQATLSTNLGEAMLRSGQYQHAERHFTQALEWANSSKRAASLVRVATQYGTIAIASR